MFYNTGLDFEQAVFGRRSSGVDLLRRFRGVKGNFAKDLTDLIKKSRTLCPDTVIGRSLHLHMARQLTDYHILPEGLLFLSSVDTKSDAFHQTDGLIYLPSLHPHVVTVDAFNIDEKSLAALKEIWIDSFSGYVYSDGEFQSDLFRHKRGLSEYKKTIGADKSSFAKIRDMRQYCTVLRPENHFILTPHMTGSYENKRMFADMVARYFAKVSYCYGQEKPAV